jgi:hypothetical protein
MTNQQREQQVKYRLMYFLGRFRAPAEVGIASVIPFPNPASKSLGC